MNEESCGSREEGQENDTLVTVYTNIKQSFKINENVSSFTSEDITL